MRKQFAACTALLTLLMLTGQALAQGQCTMGVAIAGAACAQVAAPVGAAVKQTGLTGSMSAQTLCTPTTCPAGLYVVHGYVLVTTAATLGTAQVSIAYSDDVGATTQTISPMMSLTGVVRVPFSSTVELSGASGITATVNVTGLTGTPSYSVYLSAMQLLGF